MLGQIQQVQSGPPSLPPSSGDVLQSWKEIATYMGRGVRTVQRYEARFGLPVRRMAGKKRAAVMAFKDEIDRWLRSASQRGPSEAETENLSGTTTMEQAMRTLQKAQQAYRLALQKQYGKPREGPGTRSGVLIRDWPAGIQFVRTELQIGITLAELAQGARHTDKRCRYAEMARKAYDAACKHVDRLLLDKETSNTLNNLFNTLSSHLLDLQPN